MPIIRVDCPNAAHCSEQKVTLAPPLAQALIRQEIGPVTEIGTAATGFFFSEFDVETGSRAGFAIRASRQGVLDLGSRTSRLAAGAR
jgi:hypothetical protein